MHRMSLTFSNLIWLIPLLPAIAGLLARTQKAANAARSSTLAAVAALVVTALNWPALIGRSAVTKVALFTPSFAILRWDLLSAVMVTLVVFLGIVIIRFSRRYLDGEAGQSRFYAWLNLTFASVLLVVLAGNLALLLAAWVATSLCLHRLLLFYPHRTGARFAARKKFVISRLGDTALLLAAVLLYRHYGTLEFDALFAGISHDPTGPLTWVAALLALCAMCKSAQLPFHTWLPDTMDTPTPVSAFMHAGIINAGGFLLVRLAPVMNQAPAVMWTLAIVGALTAAFGAVVMLTQPAVKRALAYSTIAQMGFMVLQCGLGAYGLALIHIVAHSLYKAYAFLTSGSTVGALPRVAIPLRTSAIGAGAGLSALLVGGGMTWLYLVCDPENHVPGLFMLITALAIAYGLARTWSTHAGRSAVWGSLGLSVGLVGLTIMLHELSTWLMPQALFVPVPSAVLLVLTGIFICLFLFQLLLWRAHESSLGRRLYVHALNGFYLGTIANRLLSQLWPSQSKSS